MIEKRISLKIETGDAKRQLDEIKTSLSGIDKNMPDSKSDPFKTTTTSTKTARKALIDYTGSLSSANRIVIQSSNYATLAEKASLAQDTAIRKLNKAYDEGRIDVTAYNAAMAETNKRNSYAVSELNKTTAASGKATAGFKVMKGATTQVSYQLQDMAVQAQMGTSWFTIIGQQGPQLLSILGPMGAILGVAIAIGAAFGGVLYKALNITTDATKELEESMTELEKAFQIGRGGAIAFSDSITDIGKQNFNAADLQIVSAVLEATKIIQSSADTIETILGETLSQKLDLSDFSFEEVQKSLGDLSKAGLSAFDVLGGIDAVTVKVTESMQKSTKTIYEQRQSIVQAESAARTFMSSISDMSDDLGISSVEAVSLSNSLDRLQKASTAEEIQGIQNGLTAFAKQAVLSSTATEKQKESLIDLVSSVVDFSEKLKISTKLSNQYNGITTDTYRQLPSLISESALATANFNSELSDVASLITDYADIEDSFNKLAASSDTWNIKAQSDAMTVFVEKIKESAAELDTIQERTELINGLKAYGISLDQESISYIQKYAQEQNYVYEKQINLLSQIGDVISQSTDKTINAANETKAWIELAGQLGEVYDQGAKDYADSVGTYNTSLQSLVTSTFSSMEDAIVSWAETGKLEFTDFVNSAISDLLRLIVQQQLAGIAAGISGSSGDTAAITSTTSGNAVDISSGITVNQAKGGAWGSEGRLSRFATGGITGMVNTVQSTPKRFANGSGMLGEAGQAEAIVPLTRTSGGDLGIKSTGSSSPTINFNVTNEAGVESSSTQSENSDGSIDINIINSLVSKSIASGYADKAITSRFDTKKRGK